MGGLGWEAELWDAWPQLSNHSLHSVAWLQRFARLSSGLHKLNKEYGKGLSKLVRKEARRGEEGGSVGTTHAAVLEHITAVAGRHKELAISLGSLAREGTREADRLLEDHKGAEAEAKKLKAGMDSSAEKLTKARDRYEKRVGEAELAEARLAKAEPDPAVSRFDLERAREEADEKKGRAERARQEYGVQLDVTNSQHRGFYRETWPRVFARMREVSREAGQEVVRHLEKLGEVGEEGWPVPEEAWTRLGSSVQLIDLRGDFDTFVMLTKTGNPLPQEHAFIESTGSGARLASGLGYKMGSLRRSMSRSSLRYRTATFPRSPAKFSSMVNIRSSLKLHRRSKTQGDSSEGGQGDTLPRTPVPITTNIEEEEEEEEENEAIRAEVRASEAKKGELSRERSNVDAEKVAQDVATAASQGDANSFHGDERGDAEDVEEKEEVEKIDINDDETLNSEDIVMENGSEDTEAYIEGEFNQNAQMQEEQREEEDAVSEDKETVQNQQKTVVTELSVNLSNGSTNGYKSEALEEEEDSEDEEDSTIGTTVTLLDDENLSALRPVSVTRHSSTISNELGILAEEEEEEEENPISFTARQSSASNPFDGLDDGKEKEEGSLSKASSKRSVHFDHGEFIFTNGKANGMLESHFGYDDKKNPFMDTFDDS